MPKRNDDMEQYLFHQGTNYCSQDYLGCTVAEDKFGFCYTFRTWAPNASAVFLVSEFCDWEQGVEMKRINRGGIWELIFCSGESLDGKVYKYLVVTEDGRRLMKGDPYARFSRGGDDGSTIIHHSASFEWHDDPWFTHRKQTVCSTEKGYYISAPLNIYEVHLPSFERKDDGTYYSYRELADMLSLYVKSMGYTHIELMPITEYPYDGSWGYQVCGYFAPTSRLGDPEDFKYFVDKMHTCGIGVLMDWVPAHFPKDAWGLYEFDGAPLYEYQGKDRQESRSWGTRFFDLGREEIQSFLVSSALFWLKEYHLDGLRVDAVASMLYLDYDRLPGEWIPNIHGDNKNLEAISFLQKLNQAVFAQFPDVLMIAEESTAFSGITHPVAEGGLGFNLKWNMGWANDMYAYAETDPAFRRYHHSSLTFPIMYAFSENYILPVSHDEVVHGKKSLLDKMHGSYEDKFKQFRTFLLLMMTFPGKKMMFMGTEYGQFSEWDYNRGLEWFMLDFEPHDLLRQYTASLNFFYLSHKALWERDFSFDSFGWIYADEADKNLAVYRRTSSDGSELICLLSFCGISTEVPPIKAEPNKDYKTVFESMPGIGKKKYTPDANSNITVSLPPFGGIVIEVSDKRGRKIKVKSKAIIQKTADKRRQQSVY